MRLHGIHHITAITADAQRTLDFYAGTLGLRLVKRTVNFDAPRMYHLYLGDEAGTPGSLVTFFEVRGAVRGRPGAGMVHRLLWRVASTEALDFWAGRLEAAGTAVEREDDRLRFADPEGFAAELVVSSGAGAPQAASAPDVPAALALQGFEGVRAYARSPASSLPVLAETLAFEADGGSRFLVAGGGRRAVYLLDPPPPEPPRSGAGTVHHVAWASHDDDHEAWRLRAAQAGLGPTQVLDRQYFRSIYFREPSGVLFELATLGPGMAVDEEPARLGEELRLPPRLAPRRAELEAALTPLTDPRLQEVRS